MAVKWALGRLKHVLVIDYEQCELLWMGVFPEVRNASRSGFPDFYHTSASILCAAGKSLTCVRPRRKETTRPSRR
ncbi:hypothetical protein BDW75DRAFT_210714 [Aspergillus navahoensis]